MKVTESVQLNVALGPGAFLKLDTVVGEQTKQILVENTITLNQPRLSSGDRGQGGEFNGEVIEDKVIIQESSINKSSILTRITWRSIRRNVPFSTFVDIPGAVQGMDIRIKPVIETIF